MSSGCRSLPHACDGQTFVRGTGLSWIGVLLGIRWGVARACRSGVWSVARACGASVWCGAESHGEHYLLGEGNPANFQRDLRLADFSMYMYVEFS